MEFLQIDVFAEAPYEGNPFALFPDASGLTKAQMQRIAQEMNLSETGFVTNSDSDSYSLRIFTPTEEIPFAGHPTLGSAWGLRHLGILTDDEVVQKTRAGDTNVRFDADLIWADRTSTSERDIESDHPQALRLIAEAVGIAETDIGLEAREIGRSGRLRPALASAGLTQLLVPVRDLSVLARARPAGPLRIAEAFGAYCFTAAGAGRIRARGFFPAGGIPEDPGTGSAVGALGAYLSDRVGPMDCEVLQGVELGKACRIFLRSHADRVSVGGRCRLVFSGRLAELP